MESTIHCQHFSCHWIQCFQFFLFPSKLLHTWSALTLRRCLKIAITLFFPFNVDFNISVSLLFYPLANPRFFSFSFITSASVAPKYLNPFRLFLPLCSRFLRVFIEGMPLALPFNVDILSRNGRISEVCHLPDDITIKALNGSLTTYKLFGVTYGNGNHFKSRVYLPSPRVPQVRWYESDGLWEHHQSGPGLRYYGIAKKLATPYLRQ